MIEMDVIGGSPILPPAWVRPTFGEIPASLDTELLLGLSDEAAVYISRPACYTNGLLFDMVAVDRTRVVDGEQWLRIIDGHGVKEDELPCEEFLYLGVEFEDGRTINNWHSCDSSVTAKCIPKIALTNLSARNRERRYAYCRYEWYLWPLPISGDVIFLFASGQRLGLPRREGS